MKLFPLLPAVLLGSLGFLPICVTAGDLESLPDGGTVSIGRNTYQANYKGGDGNDLTLTVVE